MEKIGVAMGKSPNELLHRGDKIQQMNAGNYHLRHTDNRILNVVDGGNMTILTNELATDLINGRPT